MFLCPSSFFSCSAFPSFNLRNCKMSSLAGTKMEQREIGARSRGVKHRRKCFFARSLNPFLPKIFLPRKFLQNCFCCLERQRYWSCANLKAFSGVLKSKKSWNFVLEMEPWQEDVKCWEDDFLKVEKNESERASKWRGEFSKNLLRIFPSQFMKKLSRRFLNVSDSLLAKYRIVKKEISLWLLIKKHVPRFEIYEHNIENDSV